MLSLSLVLLAYGLATLLGGNGFLAVYLAGILAGNQDFIHKRSLARFHDGLAWVMQIMMFLTLGLLVFPSELGAVAGVGLLVAAVLVQVLVIARTTSPRAETPSLNLPSRQALEHCTTHASHFTEPEIS